MDESDFACPICLNLLYKPAVNTVCGHAFCFYCLFRAMSPYEASHCPLCRHAFGHLPGVCGALDAALRLSFPSSYAARADEEEEAGQGPGQGFSIHGLQPDAAGPARLPASLHCCHPDCDAVLALPRVLACGHALCCAHAAPARARGGAWGCPLCAAPTPLPVARCGALDRAVAVMCPQLHAAAAAQERTGSDPAGETLAKQGTAAADQDRHPAMAARTEPSQAGVPAEREAQVSATGFSQPPARTLDAFVHFGVGCDVCGVHPIVGRRWRCRDCPAAIGFDLCSGCHASHGAGLAVVGKFNQGHEPDHELEEVRPRSTWLHLLQGLNPDLSPGQLLGLLSLAQSEDSEEAPAEGGGQEDGREESQSESLGAPAEVTEPGDPAHEAEEGAGEPASDGMGPGFMPSSRGPRPVRDEAAAWPSPASPPSPNPDGGC